MSFSFWRVASFCHPSTSSFPVTVAVPQGFLELCSHRGRSTIGHTPSLPHTPITPIKTCQCGQPRQFTTNCVSNTKVNVAAFLNSTCVFSVPCKRRTCDFHLHLGPFSALTEQNHINLTNIYCELDIIFTQNNTI